MKSISLGVACLILYVVFNQNHVQASCKPGTYPSKHMVGSIQCVLCPDKCEHQWNGDIDACKKACEKERSTPSTPVTQSTSPIRTPPVNSSPPIIPEKERSTPSMPVTESTSPPSSPHERNGKNKTTETVVAEVSGLTDADRLAIIIGVLAVFVLFLIVAVFLMWKNSKSLSVDVKVDEEEAREMCSNSESSVDYNATTNDKRRESDEESESASECSSEVGSDSGSVQIVDTTNGVPSNHYPSSELCLHESETYF